MYQGDTPVAGGAMTARDVQTADDARRLVEARGLSHVKVGLFDMDGIMRGKYMSRDKFLSALDGGFGFCDVIMGWDSHDQLYDNVQFTGWHTGYPDAPVRIIPESAREIPWEDGMVFFLCEMAPPADAVCPRGLLRRVIDRAAAMGFDVNAAFEYEFFLFEETPHSIREKRYRDLKTITPGYFGYSVLRNSVWADFHRAFLTSMETMELDVEGFHTETGPGVLEAAIGVKDMLEAADRAAMFKTFTKVFAQRNGLMATFMSKWSMDWPGQSGHLHMSLKARDGGGAVFHDPARDKGMSDAMRHFIAGQQKLMPEFLAMVAQTVNAYSRLIPGFWAPTDATWGVENRTTALRVIPGSAKSQRIEYRIGAADANPYLVAAAALASGLHGIEHGLEPEKPVEGNAYEKTFPARLALPRTLWEAAQALKKSKAAAEWFGPEFVQHFAATREWEEREFRRHVTDWELERYFEII